MAEIKNNINEVLNIGNQITVDGVVVKGQQCNIDSKNPERITFNEWTNDPILYKENRIAIRALEADFEDYCYAKQDEILAAVAE
jgi:hypothetical protein